mmetsp:Transcript_6965/g.17107  ORF Transcript_6965/g.17107 Transcript_6965/m.17107 type:complete len:276 (-) Transcript_6965:115-942(-)
MHLGPLNHTVVGFELADGGRPHHPDAQAGARLALEILQDGPQLIRAVPREPDAVASIAVDVPVNACGFQAGRKRNLKVHGGLGTEHDVSSEGIPMPRLVAAAGRCRLAAAAAAAGGVPGPALGRWACTLDVEAPQIRSAAKEEAVRDVRRLAESFLTPGKQHAALHPQLQRRLPIFEESQRKFGDHLHLLPDKPSHARVNADPGNFRGQLRGHARGQDRAHRLPRVHHRRVGQRGLHVVPRLLQHLPRRSDLAQSPWCGVGGGRGVAAAEELPPR